METTLYLIAHKVRGQPALDVAQKMDLDDEVAWIIPTSGHRAYPFMYWAIEELCDISDYPHKHPHEYLDKMPNDLPDHYQVSTAPKSKSNGRDLLAKLGLMKPPEPMNRRSF